jgi:diacylglycerol kinase family enzyme
LVDVAEVNGRTFINNSGLGLYPEVVHGRVNEQRLGRGKWHSLLISALRVFRRYPLISVTLTIDGVESTFRTPFVFIGNNEYVIDGFDLGSRERIDRGRLCIYMSRHHGRLGLVKLFLLALFGSLSQERDFLSASTDRVTIATRKRKIRVALDGEITIMEPPLHYSSVPAALNVIVGPEYLNNIRAREDAS